MKKISVTLLIFALLLYMAFTTKGVEDMPLSANRETFQFNHLGQPDEYGASVGDISIVQANFDSRAQENLDDINNIKDTLRSVEDGDSGADNVGATPIPALGSANTVQAQIEKIVELCSGYMPPADSITDSMLKQTGDNILPRFNAHLAENVTQTMFVSRDMSLAGIQTITGLLGMPKRIEIRAATWNWVQLTFSIGSYEVNESKQSASVLASGNISYARNDIICGLFNTPDKYTFATLKNLTESQFELHWYGSDPLATGEANLQIIIHYHGGLT